MQVVLICLPGTCLYLHTFLYMLGTCNLVRVTRFGLHFMVVCR